MELFYLYFYITELTIVRIRQISLTCHQRHPDSTGRFRQVFDSDMRSLAIKQVFLENADEATAEGYMNEIGLLRSLKHSDRVVQLMDL